MKWRRVSKDEFYKTIGPINCHPFIEGDWPYKSLFKTPSGDVVGKVVPEGYFLKEDS